MTAASPSPVRRSTRSRQRTSTVYDEARQSLEQQEQQDASDHSVLSDESSVSSIEEEKLPMPIPKKKKIKTGKSPKRNLKTKKSNSKSILSVITSLSKSSLEPNEDNLFSQLFLHILKPNKEYQQEKFKSVRENTCIIHSPFSLSLYTLAKEYIQSYNHDTNHAQCALINLLFRMVGGSSRILLQDVELEELDNEEWGTIVTDLVDDMRYTPEKDVLVSSDPYGVVHCHAYESLREKNDNCMMRDVPLSNASQGVTMMRTVLMEFIYFVGLNALVDGNMSSAVSVAKDFGGDDNEEEEEEESDNDKDEEEKNKRGKRGRNKNNNKKKTTSSNSSTTSIQRLDTEAVKEILSRLVELVAVGQPDIRAAATSAVYSLSLAILDKSSSLLDKLSIIQRQCSAATGKKKDSLQYQVDTLQRTLDAMEDLLDNVVIKGVFIHRYRDSNMFIRKTSLELLEQYVIRRPDLFLKDKYLKYFGWMLSDKDEIVRMAAIQGLYQPFKEILLGNSKISYEMLENVFNKFLMRIVDTVTDVLPSVQECGVKLLLEIQKAGFMDEIEDEQVWDQINLLSMDANTTAEVRRDALYFVMEQLEEFEEENEDTAHKNKSNKNEEKILAHKLDAIAAFASHTLTNGEIPLNEVRIESVDYLVESIRDMPRHKDIVRNWSSIILSIMNEKQAMTLDGASASDRANAVKAMVLVRMLSCAVKLEVEAVAEQNFLTNDVEVLKEEDHAIKGDSNAKGKRKSLSSNDRSHETLSVALIKNLPQLLKKFKSDTKVLQDLTLLPRYLVQSVFNVTERKSDFTSLLKALSDIYTISTNEAVLSNCARSLKYLSSGSHARSNDAFREVKKIVSNVCDKIEMNLELSDEVEEKGKPSRSSLRRKSARIEGLDSDDDESQSKSVLNDRETALVMNLQRAKILSLYSLFVSSADGKKKELENFCDNVVEGMKQRLDLLQVKSSADESIELSPIAKQVWFDTNKRLHLTIARSIEESLDLLVSIIGWKLADVQEDVMDQEAETDVEDDEETEEDEKIDHVLLRLRNMLVTFIESCFFKHIPMDEKSMYLESEVEFSEMVQEATVEVASDLRNICQTELEHAKSPLLKAFSTFEDSRLIGGSVRLIRERLGTTEEANNEKVVPLLSSISRAVIANWKEGNRREAGVLLSLIMSSDSEVSEIANVLNALLKEMQPVRFLEAQMASLRYAYEDWIDSDPADIDDENPTDEMMENFEVEEAKHKALFEKIVEQADRFSQSLREGKKKKLTDETLSNALLGFMKEGIRFSFTNHEDFMVGSRLTFLPIFGKYARWVKKNASYMDDIEEYLEDKEIELRKHEEFQEVHEDDLAALEDFRKELGLGPSQILAEGASTVASYETGTTGRSSRNPATRVSGGEDDESDESRDDVHDLSSQVTPATSTGATSAARRSRASSGGSIRSRMSSVRSSLSPLYETKEEDGSEESSGRSSKRSRFDESLASPTSKRSRYDESLVSGKSGEDDESMVSDGSHSPSTMRSGRSKYSVAESSMASATTYSRSQSVAAVKYSGEEGNLESPSKDEESLESPHK